MVNEILKYVACTVGDRILKLVSLIYKKWEVPRHFRSNFFYYFNREADKIECGNYRGVSLVL